MNEFGETPLKKAEKNRLAEILFKRKGKETVSNDLVEARKKVIKSIAANGLKSSESLEQSEESPHLRSVDKNPNEDVYGRVFKPRSQHRDDERFLNSIKHALYMTDNSIMTVVAERLGESGEDSVMFKAEKYKKKEIEARLSSSIMVVYKANEGDDYYTRPEGELNSDNIICILMPENIADHFQPDELNELGIDVRVVKKQVKRRLFHGDKLKIPDYEEHISSLLEEHKTPLWIHGVRLHTREDLAKENAL